MSVLTIFLILTQLFLVGWLICIQLSRGGQLQKWFGRRVEIDPNTKTIQCRIRPVTTRDQGQADSFSVEICGFIRAGGDVNSTSLSVTVSDITDGLGRAMEIYSGSGQSHSRQSRPFCYSCNMGPMPCKVLTFSDWLQVAHFPIEWLVLPRKGYRHLRFEIAIFSDDPRTLITSGFYDLEFENLCPGYLDHKENLRKAKSHAVGLAFAVSGSNGCMPENEIAIITDWAKNHLGFEQDPKAARQLKRALNHAIDFFREGNQVDITNICRELTQIAPPAIRYEILDLCLRVAAADGKAAKLEIAILKAIAQALEINMDRFREMIQKVLPPNTHEVKDWELIFGITETMPTEQIHRRLKDEYRKWNSRVTSYDRDIRSQADYMLNLITEVRNSYDHQNGSTETADYQHLT